MNPAVVIVAVSLVTIVLVLSLLLWGRRTVWLATGFGKRSVGFFLFAIGCYLAYVLFTSMGGTIRPPVGFQGRAWAIWRVQDAVELMAGWVFRLGLLSNAVGLLVGLIGLIRPGRGSASLGCALNLLVLFLFALAILLAAFIDAVSMGG